MCLCEDRSEIESLRAHLRGLRESRLLHRGQPHGPRDGPGHLVLEREHVVRCSREALLPDALFRLGLDQPHVDLYLLAVGSHGPFDECGHIQGSPDLRQRLVGFLEAHRGRA